MTKKMMAMQIMLHLDWDGVKQDIEQMTAPYVTIDFGTAHWDEDVHMWCLKALNLTYLEGFLLRMWAPFNPGLYGIRDAREDLDWIKGNAPGMGKQLTENKLMQYRVELEQLINQNIPY